MYAEGSEGYFTQATKVYLFKEVIVVHVKVLSVPVFGFWQVGVVVDEIFWIYGQVVDVFVANVVSSINIGSKSIILVFCLKVKK